MRIEVDQSNKVEQTEQDMVLALSNGLEFVVVLKTKDKRTLQEEFRLRGEPRNFVLFTFSALLAVLVKRSKVRGGIFVDHEYLNHENVVYDRFIEYSRILKNESIVLLKFIRLGKLSGAHVLAAKVATKKRKAEHVVKLLEIRRLIFPKKKIWHSQREPRNA